MGTQVENVFILRIPRNGENHYMPHPCVLSNEYWNYRFYKDINDQRLKIIFKNIPKNTILLIEDIDRLVSKNDLTNEFRCPVY